jgi:hypothetical protein
LQKKPKKIGYQSSPGDILNAYREGDITFEEAVKELEAWKFRKVKDALLAKKESPIVIESQREMRLRMGF